MITDLEMRIGSPASPRTGTSAPGASRTEPVDLCACLKDRTACMRKVIQVSSVSESGAALLFHFTRDEMVCGISRNQRALVCGDAVTLVSQPHFHS